MGILLEDKEIEAIPATNFGDNTDDRNMCKAQLRKVVEWGETVCMEHGMKKRRRCDKCWKAILKEAE